MPLLALLLVTTTPLGHPPRAVASPLIAASAGMAGTNPATKNAPASLPGGPVPSPAKRKAGFLAGTGLAILSLLGLAAALALVRTFKR